MLHHFTPTGRPKDLCHLPLHGGDNNDYHHAGDSTEVYLEDEHVPLIKSEEEYVKQRYFAVARTLAEEPLRITRAQAAEKIGISVRQMKRVVKRFLTEGIAGLRKKSTRPHSSPNRISEDVENRIVEVRKATGFGSGRIAVIINAGLELEGKDAISDSTCYNVLVRNGLVEAERRAQAEYKSFEWGHPDESKKWKNWARDKW